MGCQSMRPNEPDICPGRNARLQVSLPAQGMKSPASNEPNAVFPALAGIDSEQPPPVGLVRVAVPASHPDRVTVVWATLHNHLSSVFGGLIRSLHFSCALAPGNQPGYARLH